MINNNEYTLGTIVTLKKEHPSKTINWEVVRLGADIKLKSTTTKDLYIMMTRKNFNRKAKEIVTPKEESQ